MDPGVAAAQAVLSVEPDAKVTSNKLDEYPIKVTVKTKSGDVVWSGRQQDLFGKNGRPAQKQIVAALKAMKK